MAKYVITAPDGHKYEITAPDGASEAQVMAYAKANYKPKKKPSKVESQSNPLESLLRGTALTGRAVVEAPLEMLGMFTDPAVSASNKYLGTDIPLSKPAISQLGDLLFNDIKPETRTEKVASAVTKAVTGVGGSVKVGQELAEKGGDLAMRVGTDLARAPGTQAVAASTGAGAAEVAKQEGAPAWMQILAALGGGVAGAGTAATTRATGNKLKSLLLEYRAGRMPKDRAIAIINQSLKENGLNVDSMPKGPREELIQAVNKALVEGSPVNDRVIRRIADYSQVSGVTPTRARVTGDPVAISRENAASQYGATSGGKNLQQLAQTKSANNQGLIDEINYQGAGKAVDSHAADVAVQNALKKMDVPVKSQVDAAYQSVRDSVGRHADLDRVHFQRSASEMLDKKLLSEHLPDPLRKVISDIGGGKRDFTVSEFVQLDQMLSNELNVAKRGNVKTAIGIVRKALHNTPLDKPASLGRGMRRKYHKARELARKRFEWHEKNPALSDAISGTEPDKLINKYILGAGKNSTVSSVGAFAKDLKKASPEIFNQVKSQIVQRLKKAALGTNSDETATFSAKNYNKALENFGMDKLSKFFSNQELRQLRTLGRVADYTAYQPKGAVFNASGTASTNAAMRGLGNLRSIPGVNLIGDSVRHYQEAKIAREALDVLGSVYSRPKTDMKPVGNLLPILMGIENQ